MMLTEVVVDRSADPIAITIGITGLDTPPDVKLLASSLAEELGAAVDVDVGFVPLTSASAPAP